eukprot:TRINITY_DN22871_c0_g4_i1.p1 TRINITY_DN22871_c0_g4~~TRINITY_DN22871_c0_g4_i1.p1  ORF type:complete len:236 (+),score=41.10 TRINITY_DN22871_c0_g4_i1:38-709(+)
MGCLACMVLTKTVAHSELAVVEIKRKLSTRSGDPFSWKAVKQCCMEHGIDDSLYELLQRATDYEESERPDAAAAAGILAESFRKLYSPTLDKRCELGAQALAAVAADVERHRDDSLIVWLSCRSGQQTCQTLQHATSRVRGALGGVQEALECLQRSLELIATIDTYSSQAGGTACVTLSGERVQGPSAVVLIAKRLHVIYRGADGISDGAIVRIEFAEPGLKL